jgi:hydroxymethylbilane synthase
VLDPAASLPAAGQGALAIEIAERDDGLDLMALLAPLNHEATAQPSRPSARCPRYGSCRCRWRFATVAEGQMHLRAMVATPDGKRMASAEVRGAAAEPKRWARRWPSCCARRMRSPSCRPA